MDWSGLHADKNVWMNKHFDKGRRSPIRRIVIHHNAGVRMSTEDCWDTWQTRKASAHYQVEADGVIGQLVHDADTAWHATGANSDGIGIEHANISGGPGWGISDETVEAGAHLVAALCRAYKLGRPTWMGNVFPHNHYNATACPGLLAGPLRDRYMSRAQAWFDAMSGGATNNTTNTPEDDMQITELYNWRDDEGRNLLDQGYEDRRISVQIRDTCIRMEAQVTALSAAVTALSQSHGLDANAVTAAVTSAVDKALADLKITLEAA